MSTDKQTTITITLQVDELVALASPALIMARVLEVSAPETADRNKTIADYRQAAETVIAYLWSYLNTNQYAVEKAKELEALKSSLALLDKQDNFPIFH